MSNERQSVQDSRLVATTDNARANVEITSVIPLAEIDGTLRAAVVPIHGGAVGKLLGTSAPSAGSNQILYAVPATTTTNITMLTVCNRLSQEVKVRLALLSGGGSSPADSEYVYFDVKVQPNSTVLLDAAMGMWLAAATTVVVRTNITGVSFVASGIEHAVLAAP